ncbi:MAG: Fic family protein [Gordonia polyisoprenivorans]|nr:Fic family protein [Gordonia polyisoprenivorans]
MAQADWEATFWPGEKVLRNKHGIHDRNQLQAVEYQTAIRNEVAIELGSIQIDRTYDAAHLQAIHRALLGEVYDWAGEIRTYGMGVTLDNGDRVQFADPTRIRTYLDDAARVIRDTPWRQLDAEAVVDTAARIYSLTNTAHPFREGNGRAMKVFVNHAAAQAGYTFDFHLVSSRVWDERSQDAMPEPGDHSPHPEALRPVFASIVRGIPAATAPSDDLFEQAKSAARAAGIDHPTAAGYRGIAYQSPAPSTSTTRTPPTRYRGGDYGR